MIKNVVIAPNGDLVRGLAIKASSSPLAIGDAAASVIPVVEGVALPEAATAGTYYLYGVDNGMVVAKSASTFTKS